MTWNNQRKIRTVNQMRKQSPRPEKEMKRASPLRGMLVALGFGSAAQYALILGFLLPGIMGYLIAVWFFVSHLGRYPEHDLIEEEQSLDGKLLKEEISGITNNFSIIKNHWRHLTIFEILSGLYKSRIDFLPQDVKSERSNRFVIIKNNWRQMTIPDLFSTLFKLQNDHDVIQRTPPEDEKTE